MPELPDVETFRKYFNRTSLHKKVAKVEEADESILEKGITGRKVKLNLKGKEFSDSLRHGKYFFGKYDGGNLVLHFGMTGYLKYYKNEDEKPKHTRLLISFENGYYLAFSNQRKLGKISLTDDADEYIKEKGLGWDPLRVKKSREEFDDYFSGKTGKLKSAFMDQGFIAGIGNIYADEIAYHTGIHPERKLKDLSEKDLKNIREKMYEILETVIEAGAERDKIPDNYLVKNREEGKDCTICSGKITKKKVGGRSTYFCTKHQE